MEQTKEGPLGAAAGSAPSGQPDVLQEPHQWGREVAGLPHPRMSPACGTMRCCLGILRLNFDFENVWQVRTEELDQTHGPLVQHPISNSGQPEAHRKPHKPGAGGGGRNGPPGVHCQQSGPRGFILPSRLMAIDEPHWVIILSIPAVL